MKLQLSSVGNPDLQQYAPLSPAEEIEVSTLEEASQKCREYIAEWGLGGGNWSGGQLDNEHQVSFNGRVWKIARTGDWKDDICVYTP